MDVSQPGADRPERWLLWLALCVSVLLALPSFTAEHAKGDELVYLSLSTAMSWDLSHYTVRDSPLVNQFPNQLYRAPLFPHPPLYPLLLKVGLAAMRAIGYLPPNFWPLLLIGLGFKLLGLFAMRALLLRVARREAVANAGALLLALCPILGLTSARLFTDSAFESLLLLSVVFLLDALERGRWKDWLLAGLTFALFLNTKYQALGFVPVPILAACVVRPRVDRTWLRHHGAKLAAALAIVGVVGGSHFARLLLTYGSVGTEPWIAADRAGGEFVEMMERRTRPQVWLYLLLIYPFWLTWLGRSFWSDALTALRARERAAVPSVLALYALAVTSLMMHTQIRYFSVFACFLIAAFVVHFERRGRGDRGTSRGLAFLGASSMLSMVCTSFLINVVFPGQKAPDVLPALVLISPLPIMW